MFKIFEQLLQEKGLTQYRFSQEMMKQSNVKILQSTLSDWKNGKSTPRNDKLKAIADFFGVSVSYLKGETDIKKQPTINSELPKDVLDLIAKLELLSEKDRIAVLHLVENLSDNQHTD